MAHGALLLPEAGEATTLTEVIQAASRQGDSRGIVWVGEDGEPQTLTYAAIFQRAARILSGLQRRGLQPGAKLLFQIDTATDFFPAFWACVLGGYVAVPLSVPSVYTPGSAAVRKLQNAWRMLEFPWVLTPSGLKDQVQSVRPAESEGPFQVECVEVLAEETSDGAIFTACPDDVAVLFLTSGSTGMSKAVIQTHRSLLAMAHGTIQMNRFTAEDCTLTLALSEIDPPVLTKTDPPGGGVAVDSAFKERWEAQRSLGNWWRFQRKDPCPTWTTEGYFW